MTDQFAISVKGILEVNGKLLLRKNERLEYELLGGRLEKGDPSASFPRAARLHRRQPGRGARLISQPMEIDMGREMVILNYAVV